VEGVAIQALIVPSVQTVTLDAALTAKFALVP